MPCAARTEKDDHAREQGCAPSEDLPRRICNNLAREMTMAMNNAEQSVKNPEYLRRILRQKQPHLPKPWNWL